MKPRKTWKRHDKRALADQITKLRAEGLTLKAIAAQIDMHRSSVCRVISLFNLQRHATCPNCGVALNRR